MIVFFLWGSLFWARGEVATEWAVGDDSMVTTLGASGVLITDSHVAVTAFCGG